MGHARLPCSSMAHDGSIDGDGWICCAEEDKSAIPMATDLSDWLWVRTAFKVVISAVTIDNIDAGAQQVQVNPKTVPQPPRQKQTRSENPSPVSSA